MITLLIYLVDGLVLGYFSVKLIISLKKSYNPFMVYFAGVAILTCLSFAVYVALMAISLKTNQPHYLYWSDFFGRFFLYAGSAFAIQIPLYKIAPKRPERVWGSIIIGALGIFLSVYNLIHPNYPYIDSLRIVHWQAPAWLGLGLAVMLVGVWLPTSIIFLSEFFKSKMKIMKSFYLGSGFFIGLVGGALQDFGTTVPSYILISVFTLVGFLLIFIGILLKGQK